MLILTGKEKYHKAGVNSPNGHPVQSWDAMGAGLLCWEGERKKQRGREHGEARSGGEREQLTAICMGCNTNYPKVDDLGVLRETVLQHLLNVQVIFLAILSFSSPNTSPKPMETVPSLSCTWRVTDARNVYSRFCISQEWEVQLLADGGSDMGPFPALDQAVFSLNPDTAERQKLRDILPVSSCEGQSYCWRIRL